MNIRTRQTLASILAAAAVTFGAPLLTSAQEAGAQHQAQIRAMPRPDPLQRLNAAHANRALLQGSERARGVKPSPPAEI